MKRLASRAFTWQGTLRFENVSFSFTKDNKKVEVLKNINLSVSAETLGIVGPQVRENQQQPT